MDCGITFITAKPTSTRTRFREEAKGHRITSSSQTRYFWADSISSQSQAVGETEGDATHAGDGRAEVAPEPSLAPQSSPEAGDPPAAGGHGAQPPLMGAVGWAGGSGFAI